jgi:AcrR family transcriptional regulator
MHGKVFICSGQRGWITMIEGITQESQTVTSRLMAAGKRLFARLGYEQVTTAAIAQEAGTSESQLMRYFGGKAGLLEAVFNECWGTLNGRLQRAVNGTPMARDALLGVLAVFLQSYRDDPDFSYLSLCEGRRVRSGSPAIVSSEGYQNFAELFRRQIRRGRKDGTFADQINEDAVEAALLGALEGLLRERLVAQRSGQPVKYNDDEVTGIFAAILDGFAPLRH